MLELFVIAVIVLLAIAILAKNKEHKESDLKYRKNKYLMSKAEISLYGCLQQIIEKDEAIHCKVRMADILKINEKAPKRRIGFNKIIRKHFDYVIINKRTGEIKYTIELDDKSHNSKKRIERDIFVDSACKSANLKLVRIKAKASYNFDEIKKLVKNNEVTTNEYR